MKLSERLTARGALAGYANSPHAEGELDRKTYNGVKLRVHSRLVKELDLASIADMPRDALAASIKDALQEIASADNLPLNKRERVMLVSDLMNEILGLALLNPWSGTIWCRMSW